MARSKPMLKDERVACVDCAHMEHKSNYMAECNCPDMQPKMRPTMFGDSRYALRVCMGYKVAHMYHTPTCPECGETTVPQGGCVVCMHCGYSACG